MTEEFFHKETKNPSGYRNQCKKCCNARARKTFKIRADAKKNMETGTNLLGSCMNWPASKI